MSLLAFVLAGCLATGLAFRRAKNPNTRQGVIMDENYTCRLFAESAEFENPSDDEWSLFCEADSGDLEIVGMPEEWLAKHQDQLVSGETILSLQGATTTNTTINVSNAVVKITPPVSGPGIFTVSKTEGTKTAIIVRVRAKDFKPFLSKEKMSNQVFGNWANRINFKERMESCSYGKFRVQPFSGTAASGLRVQGGAIDVTINSKAWNVDNKVFEDLAKAEAEKQLGPLDQFDHVMFAFPFGTKKDGKRFWMAYGANGRWKTVYNEGWIGSTLTNVHEIGHNIGLGHSTQNGEEYGDRSGFMGSGLTLPKLCFNGPKNWQLGWYPNGYTTVVPSEVQGKWKCVIIGVASYPHAKWGRKVVVKVETGRSIQFYLSFNFAGGINKDTIEGRNKVLVHSADYSNAYKRSALLAKLGAKEYYEVTDGFANGKKVKFYVERIYDVEKGVKGADVYVYESDIEDS